MSNRIMLFSLIFCNLVLSGEVSAEGQQLIVPTHFKTIKEAAENAKPGDTILIKEGVYEEKEGFNLKSGLRIEGKGADKTIVKVGRQGIKKASFWDNPDIITEKLITKEISNESPRPDGAKESDKVIVRLAPQGAAKAAGQDKLDNVVIKDLSIELSGEPLRLYDANGFLLQNCVITSKGTSTCIEVSTSKNVQILNCTIANSALGVSVMWGPVELTIRNSIFYNNNTAIKVQETPIAADTRSWPKEEVERLRQQPREDVKLTLAYSDFWDNAVDYGNCTKGEFDIKKDPEFIDDKKPDFHLKSGSACIDAGDPDKKYNDPDGSRNDMGAFPIGAKK
jgi:hypothetical protein